MFLNEFKKSIARNAKNVVGWKTNRKIIVISVDDYGNVRLDSKEARERLDRVGIKAHNRFDAFDTLETRQDLESLYDALTSVTDRNGRHAIFTPFALPCNINFEKIIKTGFSEYHYELLSETYSKLTSQQPNAYEGAWDLWQEGIARGIFKPQFHGREHLNLKLFKEKLQKKDKALLTAINNRSFARIPSDEYSTISKSAAFDFWDFQENNNFDEIIAEGLSAFEEVFGYRAVHFNPPGGREHPVIHKTLKENGIRYIDTPLLKREHQGEGKFKMVFNYTGKKNPLGQIYLVRNVVFEPTADRGIDWVSYAMQQIEAAFRWNRPAIISSHRVNFCGHIDEQNRKQGLQALKELLKNVTERWPEVEFMAANELGTLIDSEQE